MCGPGAAAQLYPEFLSSAPCCAAWGGWGSKASGLCRTRRDKEVVGSTPCLCPLILGPGSLLVSRRVSFQVAGLPPYTVGKLRPVPHLLLKPPNRDQAAA